MDKEEILEDVNEEQIEETVEMNEESVEQDKETPIEVQDDSKGKEDEYLNRLMRLQADFDNFRKRTAKEKEDIYKYALSDFAEKLLPVMDNMERALKAIDDAGIRDGYVDGVKMVSNQLIETLKSEGLAEVESLNVEFDPQCHHGVAVEEVADVEDNHIIEVYQKGYKFKDKVIRPAMVKICKK